MLYLYFTGARPRNWRERLIVWLIERASPGLTHVCFGDDQITVSPIPQGDEVHDTAKFRAGMIRAGLLRWIVEIPTDCSPVVSSDATPSCWWRVPIAVLLNKFGVPFPADDCVQRALRSLTTNGIKTPDIRTPAQLWDWLRSQGFTFIDPSSPVEDAANVASAAVQELAERRAQSSA